MGRYVIKRVGWVVFIMLVITLFAFLIFYVLPPGEPADAFAGRNPTAQSIAEVKKAFGLDHGIFYQYGLFVKRLFLGDQYGWPGFGFSFASRDAIRPDIISGAWVTLQLAVGAAVVWLLMGIPIGIISALKRGQVWDRMAMGFALFGVSAPVFWLGLMGLYIFWYRLHWAPGTFSGVPSFTGEPFQWFTHFLMPWFVLAFLFAASYARITRGSMLEVMGEDYIRTARAKGLPERDVVIKHGLRSSLVPVVTLFGLDFGGLVGGAIVTERVFNLPGLGNITVQAVLRGDLPVVMGVVVFAALGITIMSLLVDIVYTYLDPRVRFA
jgi:peptide/nickel transport system permease protein